MADRASAGGHDHAMTPPPSAVQDLPVGGQAVMEGVMMRGPATWAVAVRLPDDHATKPAEIVTHVESYRSVLTRHRLLRIPVLRGFVALVESLRVGIKTLGISANAPTPAGEREPMTGIAWVLTVAAGLGLAVGLFFLAPAAITSLVFGDALKGSVEFVATEKILRILIFIGYLWAVARMAHLQRVFEYHGAEHKTIACLEAGRPLTPENAQRFSRLHPRCGTSFMLIVILMSIVVLAPLGKLPLGWLLLSRVVGIPLIAGLSYETIKWIGRHRDQRLARILAWPGMQLQRMTTREPDHAQLQVAIAALTAVTARDDLGQAGDGDHAALGIAA